MSNSKQAFPQIEVKCRDGKVRSFCMNIGAFRALEEHMIAKTGNAKFRVSRDYDWNSDKMEDVILMFWSGFVTDAKRKGEILTPEMVEDQIDLGSIQEMKQCIEISLARTMSAEQTERIREDAELEKAEKEKAQKKTAVSRSSNRKRSKKKTAT